MTNQAIDVDLIDAATFAKDALDQSASLFDLMRQRLKGLSKDELFVLCSVGARTAREAGTELGAALDASDEADPDPISDAA